MTTTKMSEVIQHLRKAVLLQDGAGLTDRQLLECFISSREEAAIAALVRRHGPMVWAVCHRVLHNHHDAEDAFQATFLVLVRKAASIVSREMFANWLYGVAHQTALNAKQVAAKRRGRERQVIEMPEPKGVEQDRSHDLQLVLDQELSRLPDKYRAVIVLCDLQGRTHKEAARQLGVPEGTIASRKATARTKLAKRLARHGLTLGGGSLAAALSTNVASACLPSSVLSSTIKAVMLVAAGKATTGAISANVAALTEGVVKAMLLTKLKTMMAVVLMLSMVTFTGVILALGQTGATSTGDKGNGGEKPAAKAPASNVPIQPQAQLEETPPKDFTNSLGMKFVWIKPGTFLMGSPKEEAERSDNETHHKVTLSKGFYMGVHLVTQEQWQAVMGNNPSRFQGEKNLPVDTVSWDDCQEFIKKLREKDKKAYRLPTEASGNMPAVRERQRPSTLGQRFPRNRPITMATRRMATGKKGVYREKTTPVGSFPANAWGLHDMHGNLWEWCQDWYGDYPQKEVVDPQGPEKGEARVLRGGSWFDNPMYCRSAFRIRYEPGRRSGLCGFRLCFSVEQEAKPNDHPKNAEADKEQPLTVTIKLQKDRIRVNKQFLVDLRVVKSPKSTESFEYMSGSWYKHWQSSNKRVSWRIWDYSKDGPWELTPGRPFESALSMILANGKPQEKVTFKMGFTPLGSKQTFWSNEVTLQVESEDAPAKEDGGLKKEIQYLADRPDGVYSLDYTTFLKSKTLQELKTQQESHKSSGGSAPDIDRLALDLATDRTLRTDLDFGVPRDNIARVTVDFIADHGRTGGSGARAIFTTKKPLTAKEVKAECAKSENAKNRTWKEKTTGKFTIYERDFYGPTFCIPEEKVVLLYPSENCLQRKKGADLSANLQAGLKAVGPNDAFYMVFDIGGLPPTVRSNAQPDGVEVLTRHRIKELLPFLGQHLPFLGANAALDSVQIMTIQVNESDKVTASMTLFCKDAASAVNVKKYVDSAPAGLQASLPKQIEDAGWNSKAILEDMLVLAKTVKISVADTRVVAGVTADPAFVAQIYLDAYAPPPNPGPMGVFPPDTP